MSKPQQRGTRFLRPDDEAAIERVRLAVAAGALQAVSGPQFDAFMALRAQARRIDPAPFVSSASAA